MYECCSKCDNQDLDIYSAKVKTDLKYREIFRNTPFYTVYGAHSFDDMQYVDWQTYILAEFVTHNNTVSWFLVPRFGQL